MLNGQHYSKTVRTSECDIMSHNLKCASCSDYRATLRSIYHRRNKQNVNQPETASHLHNYDGGAHKFTNNKYLSTPEKVAKIDSLQKKGKLYVNKDKIDCVKK